MGKKTIRNHFFFKYFQFNDEYTRIKYIFSYLGAHKFCVEMGNVYQPLEPRVYYTHKYCQNQYVILFDSEHDNDDFVPGGFISLMSFSVFYGIQYNVL